jgi:hypothetical protein
MKDEKKITNFMLLLDYVVFVAKTNNFRMPHTAKSVRNVRMNTTRLDLSEIPNTSVNTTEQAAKRDMKNVRHRVFAQDVANVNLSLEKLNADNV